MEIEVKIFRSKNEIVIGTLCTDENGESFLHYNYATSQTQVDIEEHSTEIKEIVNEAQEYCENEGYLLTSY